MADTKDLSIQQGKTFSLALRWETEPIIHKPITAITLAFGAPQLMVPGHGVPDGWRVAITRVKGMQQINANNSPPRDVDYHMATAIDADTIELNAVSPFDDSGKEWPAYSSGGFVQFNTPVDLTGYTARMQVKDKVGGALLASTEIDDAPLNILNIAINATNKVITLTISAADTAAIAWKKGVYDLEMISATGVVTAILAGGISVSKEITT